MLYLYNMNNKICSLDTLALLARISVAAVFIYHGYAKVMDIETYISMFAGMGISALLTYVVAYAELLGGIAILLGVLTRYAAALHAIIMIVAIYLVHFKNGFNNMNGGYEFQLTLLLVSIGLVLAGAGAYSIDALLAKRKAQ